VEDTQSYARALIKRQDSEVMYRTSAFLWRRIGDLEVFLNIWDGIKHGIHVTVHGMGALFSDGIWAIRTRKQ